jgi:hypothetical protein
MSGTRALIVPFRGPKAARIPEARQEHICLGLFLSLGASGRAFGVLGSLERECRFQGLVQSGTKDGSRAPVESNRIETGQGSIRTNQIRVQNSSIRTN